MSKREIVTCDQCQKNSFDDSELKTMEVSVTIGAKYFGDVCSVKCAQEWIEAKVKLIAAIETELSDRVKARSNPSSKKVVPHDS